MGFRTSVNPKKGRRHRGRRQKKGKERDKIEGIKPDTLEKSQKIYFFCHSGKSRNEDLFLSFCLCAFCLIPSLLPFFCLFPLSFLPQPLHRKAQTGLHQLDCLCQQPDFIPGRNIDLHVEITQAHALSYLG